LCMAIARCRALQSPLRSCINCSKRFLKTSAETPASFSKPPQRVFEFVLIVEILALQADPVFARDFVCWLRDIDAAHCGFLGLGSKRSSNFPYPIHRSRRHKSAPSTAGRPEFSPQRVSRSLPPDLVSSSSPKFYVLSGICLRLLFVNSALSRSSFFFFKLESSRLVPAAHQKIAAPADGLTDVNASTPKPISDLILTMR